ncbi:MAG: SusE domain-containing protein [Bacteroidota bacterium]
MKNFAKNCLVFFLALTTLIGCKKDENKIFYQGADNSTLALTSSLSGTTPTVPLSFATKGDRALRLIWTNPEYQFSTGVSSQDVTYLVEIDTAGADFKSTLKKQLQVSKEIIYDLTQNDLNDYLLNRLKLAAGEEHEIEVHVIATLNGNQLTKVTSNVLTLKVTPFVTPPKITPPANLYVTGSATPAGWQTGNSDPEPTPTQKFTKLSETLFELTVQLSGGNSYLLLPQYGSWNAKYGVTGDNNSNDPAGGDFKAGGGDILAPANSGMYKITVDFQSGTFTVVAI